MNEPLFDFAWNQVETRAEHASAVLTVASADAEGRLHAVGSAFVVKARDDLAIAVSAAHVFSEVQRLQRPRYERSHPSVLPEFAPARSKIDLSLERLVLLGAAGSQAIVCRVIGLAFDERGDIGVLQLRPQSAADNLSSLREFLLEDEAPKVGDLVGVASYVDLESASSEPGKFGLWRRSVIRVGTVLDVFREGQRLCQGPCMETSIPMYSGMSGSPVFLYRRSGAVRVVGLVCSDPDADGPAKDDRSVAGRSLISLLPTRRVAGSADGLQVVDMSFTPTLVAGEFHSADGMKVRLTEAVPQRGL